MNGGFHLAPVRRIPAAGRRIVGAVDLDDLAVFVLHDAGTGDEIAVAQTDLRPGDSR